MRAHKARSGEQNVLISVPAVNSYGHLIVAIRRISQSGAYSIFGCGKDLRLSASPEQGVWTTLAKNFFCKWGFTGRICEANLYSEARSKTVCQEGNGFPWDTDRAYTTGYPILRLRAKESEKSDSRESDNMREEIAVRYTL
jgi:hypothetical protein